MSPVMHEFLGRMKRLFRGRRAEQDMADEMEFHQAMLRSRFMREGMPEGEASRVARRTFGDQRRWQERLREVWQFRWLENFVRDVRFSARCCGSPRDLRRWRWGRWRWGWGRTRRCFR
jgi:hypothetical protein